MRPAVRSLTTAAAESAEISPVAGSTSHSTGVAPAWSTPSAEAMNVCAGTMTSSPGTMPAADSAIASAAVPEATPTQCSTSQ